MKKAFYLNLTSLRGSEFPNNLVATKNMNFAVQFMLATTNEVLEEISKLCAKTKEPVELWFSYQESPETLPQTIPDSDKFCNYANLPFRVGESLGQYLPYAGSPITHYIDIIFTDDSVLV